MNDVGTVGGRRPLNPDLIKAVTDSVRQGGPFLNVAHEAHKKMLAFHAGETGGVTVLRESETGSPELTPPTDSLLPGLNKDGAFTYVVGKLIVLLGESSLKALETRLATWRAMRESEKAMSTELSKEFEKALGESEAATAAFKTATQNSETANAAVTAAQSKADEAKSKLDKMSPNDSGYADAKAALDTANTTLAQAKTAASNAADAAAQAQQVATQKAAVTDGVVDKIHNAGIDSETAKQADKDNLNNLAKLTEVMARFSKLLGDNSERSLKNELSLFEAMQDSRQKEMEKKADEYQKEVKKAETLNTVMGCLGKILGAILTVVSVVSAAFTGGASLALAAVGVGLMVADEICKAVTGKSFIEEALKPLMDKILKPLMEMLSKAITKALEGLGVDKGTAEMVGAVVGAVIAAVVMVVAMVAVATVGKNAASKMGDMLGKLIGDAVKDIVPQVLKDLASGTGKLFSQGMERLTKSLGLGSDEASQKLVANTLDRVVTAGSFINSTIQGIGGVEQGVFRKKAAEALAGFSLARASMEQLEKWLQQAVETFGSNLKITQDLTVNMSNVFEQTTDAGRFVLGHTRA